MHWNVARIFNNPIIVSAFIAWFVAQFLKMFTCYPETKKIIVARSFSSAGMPSSHTSIVTSVSTAVGILHGFDSAIFAVSMAIAMIVMYDAAGVRRETGRQAQIINNIVEKMLVDHEISVERLKELVGHKPIEVLAGAALGILTSVFYCLAIS